MKKIFVFFCAALYAAQTSAQTVTKTTETFAGTGLTPVQIIFMSLIVVGLAVIYIAKFDSYGDRKPFDLRELYKTFRSFFKSQEIH